MNYKEDDLLDEVKIEKPENSILSSRIFSISLFIIFLIFGFSSTVPFQILQQDIAFTIVGILGLILIFVGIAGFVTSINSIRLKEKKSIFQIISIIGNFLLFIFVLVMLGFIFMDISRFF